jgi:anti-anti-sigma factor
VLIIDHRLESPLAATVVLCGELDLATADDFTRAMRLVSEQLQPSATCTVSIEDLAFMDSTGLRCVLACRAASSAKGVTLRFDHPTAQVMRLLEVTDTAGLLGIGVTADSTAA